MVKIALIAFLGAFLVLVTADPERSRKYLPHDPTVINCAKYKREANQHSCVLSPFNVEGPFFLTQDYERSDLTDGQPGISFDLNLRLVNSNDCNPLENVFVHIWHANTLGDYSGVDGFGNLDFGDFKGTGDEIHEGGPPSGRPTPDNDERWFRGYQLTDSNGEVNFKTKVPGWYFGRALHIHVEVYRQNTTSPDDIAYVGQIFFDENLPSILRLIDPYSENTNPITLNSKDMFYTPETHITLNPSGSDSYKSSLIFGINPDVTPEINI